MIARVRKTPAARQDLVEIGKYIARQSGIRDTAENLLHTARDHDALD